MKGRRTHPQTLAGTLSSAVRAIDQELEADSDSSAAPELLKCRAAIISAIGGDKGLYYGKVVNGLILLKLVQHKPARGVTWSPKTEPGTAWVCRCAGCWSVQTKLSRHLRTGGVACSKCRKRWKLAA